MYHVCSFLRSIGRNTNHVSCLWFFTIYWNKHTPCIMFFSYRYQNLNSELIFLDTLEIFILIFLLKQTLSLCLSHQIKHFKLKTCIKFYSTLIQRFVKKNEIIITEAFTSLAVFKRDPVKNFKFVGLCKILVRTDDYCKENPKKMAKYWQIKRQAERYF